MGPYEGNLTADVALGGTVSNSSDPRGPCTCNWPHPIRENVSKVSWSEGGETWLQLLYLEGLEEEHFEYICPRWCDYDITL